MTYEGPGEPLARLRLAATQLSRPGVGAVVLTGDDSDGMLSVLRSELAPGAEISAHFHRTFAETFYVLSGTVEFGDGSSWREADPGSVLVVPQGGIHAVRNASAAAAELLVLSTPGVPRERYVLELLTLRESGRELDPGEWTAFLARHDQYLPG